MDHMVIHIKNDTGVDNPCVGKKTQSMYKVSEF